MKALCCKIGLGLIWELPIFIAWSKQESCETFSPWFLLLLIRRMVLFLPTTGSEAVFLQLTTFCLLPSQVGETDFLSHFPHHLCGISFSYLFKVSARSLEGLRKFSLNDVGPTFKGCRIYIRLRRLRPQVQLRTL